MNDGLTVTKSRHFGDCWNVVIAEWLGLDYDHVRQTAIASGLVASEGFANTENVLRALGYDPRTISDDGHDGIIRIRQLEGANHVVVRCCGELLNSFPAPCARFYHSPFTIRERIVV
jgi:hypothetical protein